MSQEQQLGQVEQIERAEDSEPGIDANRLQTTREQGQRLLSEARAAIAAALSIDSQAYLNSNRQTGGQ